MMKRLSSDAVERILRAVGPKIKPIQISSPNEPPVLDLDLLYSLHESIEYYYGAVQRRSDKKKLDRIRRLKAISKAAGRLEDLLKPDDDWEWAQDSEHEFLLGRISDLRSKVESEIDDLKHKIEWGDDADDIGMGKSRDLTDALRTRSPFEWLVGSYLPETFRKCFGREPTLIRRTSDNKLSGPYVQFAEQVLIEFEIMKNGRPYGREAIAKAFGDVKRGRTRRVPRRR